MAKAKMQNVDLYMDMTPMIDMIFQLLIFFMLTSKLTAELSSEMITVPPTLNAKKLDTPMDWRREKVQVWGSTQSAPPGQTPQAVIQIGDRKFTTTGKDDFSAYVKLRGQLDIVYAQAEKYQDPKVKGLMLPKVIIELRANADTEYRVVQEVQQILCDSIDPSNNMLPKKQAQDLSTSKAFVHIHFTTRLPGE